MLNSSAVSRHPADEAGIYTHNRTRTTSSNTVPLQSQFGAPMQLPMHLSQPQPPQAHQRRSPSVNTFSTQSSSGGTMQPPAAYRTSPVANASDLRRSTSSRSGGTASPHQPPQPTSYVALLRKQKATVWCDRAQYEDPRMLAQQRAARVRAQMQIVGASGSGSGPLGGSDFGGPLGGGIASSGRTSTGLSIPGGKVAAKIRHHGKPAVVGYSPESNNYIGVGGVPVRLSATEVEGGDSDEDDVAMQRLHHRRTGSSGRSSTASGRRSGLQPYRTSGGGNGLGLVGSGGGGRRWSPGDTPERTGSLVEEREDGGGIADDSASGKARSMASASEGERADSVPDLGGNAARLASNSLMHSTITREKSIKSAEELKRRGSVDERAMSMSTGRLFIANPD